MATRREKVDVVTDFLFLGSKITADGDCSHEIRRRLLLGRKAMTNPDNVMKSGDITLPIRLYSQGYGLPWRRKCQPTPVLLPGESHGQRSLVGYSPRGWTVELDTTEMT